jgi:hypothetical protein
MNAKNIPTVQADFLDKINLNVSSVVWAGVGTGSLATVINHFDKPEYHVQRVIMPRVDHETFMVLPVLGENQKISHYLSDEMKVLEKAQESKKLVLVFDDLSSSTVAGSRAFYEAVVNRKFGGISLKDTDIVMAVGTLDSEGNMINDVVPMTLMNKVAHYVLHHEKMAA